VSSYLRLDRFGGDLRNIFPELAGAAVLVLGICIAATIIPLRLAHRRIEMTEW
jgi:hypothetical protein